MLALSFDDVLLTPLHSSLKSRDEVDLSTFCGWEGLKIPILSAPMDTTTSIPMLRAMQAIGADGIHHRYCSMEELHRASSVGPVAVSPSMGLDNIRRLPGQVFVVDVAHGDTKPALELAYKLRREGRVVISGSIVSPEAARRYLSVGVDIFRVGVGAGASCSTRLVAGTGYPQLSAIIRIRKEFPLATIISDGGCRNSGHIVKALAAGASCVMLGRLLSGAKESPGKRRFNVAKWQWEKQFRGMASRAALREAGKEINEEGISTWISIDGYVADIVSKLIHGVRAGFAYCGARSLRELQHSARFVRITHAGYIEGLPRG